VKAALVGTADADDVQFAALSLLLAARLRLAEGEWDEGRQLVAEALPMIERTDEHFYLVKAYALGVRLEAERVAAGRGDAQAGAIADDLLARLFAARDRLLAQGVTLLPEPAAELLTVPAEAARVRQADEPEQWATAAAEWDALGQPLRAATARLRQAAALVRLRGSRAEAAELLADARAAAETAGAKPLLAAVDALVARTGRGVGPGTRSPTAAFDVTPRELDVLRLVAQGRTNRQIGEQLFISEKTASVHVTNLLRKLGVASRVEAAALAVRSGVADPEG
jgi:DNA-binding CsgD family transcriptional regulator